MAKTDHRRHRLQAHWRLKGKREGRFGRQFDVLLPRGVCAGGSGPGPGSRADGRPLPTAGNGPDHCSQTRTTGNEPQVPFLVSGAHPHQSAGLDAVLPAVMMEPVEGQRQHGAAL